MGRTERVEMIISLYTCSYGFVIRTSGKWKVKWAEASWISALVVFDITLCLLFGLIYTSNSLLGRMDILRPSELLMLEVRPL